MLSPPQIRAFAPRLRRFASLSVSHSHFPPLSTGRLCVIKSSQSRFEIENGELRIVVEKLRFSSIIVRCLPFVCFLHGGIRNSTLVLTERASPFPTKCHGESTCPTVPQSDDFVVTAPEVALQPVTQGRLGSFATSITTPIKKVLTSSYAPPPKPHLSVICRRTK